MTDPSTCLWCGVLLLQHGPQTCPSCGREIRPITLDGTTLGKLAETMRARDLIVVMAATEHGLRFTFVDAECNVQTLSLPAGEGRDVRPVNMLKRRLERPS